MKTRLDLEILSQPDDSTCGPTCLQAVYGYYGLELPLQLLIDEVPRFESGGTLAVMLGIDALRRGFEATIQTYNLQVFDPTWFAPDGPDLEARLRAQREAKDDPKLQVAITSYLEFLELGGEIRYGDLTAGLLRRFLKQRIPILTGLSATYLYGTPREREEGNEIVYDDVGGFPQGHFVVLCGYDPEGRSVLVADPLLSNPVAPGQQYTVTIDRLVCAILIGILTYDANLLVIRPGAGADAQPHRRRES